MYPAGGPVRERWFWPLGHAAAALAVVPRRAGPTPPLARRGGAVPVPVVPRRRGCSCSGRPGRREGPRESTRYTPIPAALPLLLWKTPPGLELILAQEGVPLRGGPRPAPARLPRRPVRPLRRPRRRRAPRSRVSLTPEHVAIDVDTLRADEPCDPFAALIDTRAARASWIVGFRKLTERVARHDKGRIRRRLIDRACGRRSTAAGGVWIRLAPFPYPYRSAFNFRADLDEPSAEDYFRFAEARAPLADCCTHFVSTHAYGDHPSVLRDLKDHDTQSHGHFHHVYRDPEANRVNLERAHRILGELRLRADGLRRAARPLERGPGRRPGGLRLPLLVRLPARLRRLPVLPLEGRPVLAGAPDPGASGLRGAVPRGRHRRRPGDRRAPRGRRRRAARRGRAGLRLRPSRAPARPDARGPARSWRGRSDRARWSGGRRSPSWRGGGAGGPSGGGWSIPREDHRLEIQFDEWDPEYATSPWRSTAATSSARCP